MAIRAKQTRKAKGPRYPASEVAPAAVLEALAQPRRGLIFDLDIGRFTGMPLATVHPSFLVTTYRTPKGLSVQRDQDWLMPEKNAAGWSFVSELVVCSMHSGTHIDGLCHVMRGWGDEATWFGDVPARESIGDFGPVRDHSGTIPPMVVSGCLLDICGLHGDRPLPAGYGIEPGELQQAIAQTGTPPQGGVILIRTGHLMHWPDRKRMAESEGAGITLATAQWLNDHFHPIAIGADTPALEQEPSTIEGNPAPAHHYLIRDNGIHIIENVALDELAAGQHFQFLFVCTPLRIEGATASLVRPIAIV